MDLKTGPEIAIWWLSLGIQFSERETPNVSSSTINYSSPRGEIASRICSAIVSSLQMKDKSHLAVKAGAIIKVIIPGSEDISSQDAIFRETPVIEIPSLSL